MGEMEMILRRWGTVAVLALISVAGCERPRLFLRDSEPKDKPIKTAKPSTLNACGDFCLSESFTKKSEADRVDKRLKARLAYQQALMKDPKNLRAFQGLSLALLSQGEKQLALETAQNGLKLYPRDPGLWMTLGKIQAQSKDWASGIASMKQAVELAPKNQHFVRTLGYTLAWSGETEESVSTFQRVMSESDARYEAARILHARHDDQQARQQLQVALAQKPNSPKAQELLSVIEKALPGSQGAIQRVNHEQNKETRSLLNGQK